VIGFQQNFYKLKTAWIKEWSETTKERKQVKSVLPLSLLDDDNDVREEMVSFQLVV
jgi:hypothetical protein